MTRPPILPEVARPVRTAPPRALVVSLFALAVPIAATKLAPTWIEGEGALLVWLPALLPAFLLAYYKGWHGASLALAGGMATLALWQVEALVLGLDNPGWPFVFAVVALLVCVAMGAGWIAELLHRERDAAERAALTDALTGLPNRRHASIFLGAAWEAALRGHPLALVLFDLDRFKLVNDLHGHTAGDDVLKTVAGALRHRTRRMDLSARFGGEEFVAILPGCSLEDGVSFAEDVRSAVAAVDFGWGHVTVSAGVSAAVEGMGSPEVLVATADRALYQAKERGRNQVVQAVFVAPSGGPAAAVAPPGPSAAESLAGVRVLLVEDDDLSLRATARMLLRLGSAVRPTTSAREALGILAGPEAVDVLITDIIMPEMSGFTLVDQAAKVRPGLPVLYISGYPMAEVYWGGTPGVRSAFLGKPMDGADLLAALLGVMAPWGPEAASSPPPKASRPEAPVFLTRPTAPLPARGAHGRGMTERRGAVAPSRAGRILVVDDEETMVRALQRLLTQAGYARPLGLTDPRRVVDTLQTERVDLMILDLSMPTMDGFKVLDSISGLFDPEEYFPVIVLTGADSPETRRRALTAGAMDFIVKPFDPTEVEARVQNLLTTRDLNRRVARHRDTLEGEVSVRTAELADTRAEILYRLARAAEYRDDVTGRHADRVGLLSAEVASALGLPPQEADLIRRTAPLHDLGKIGVPDAVLLKPGPLTAAEVEIMQAHTTIGAEILGGSRHRILEMARAIALSHHERWDGGGYPDGRASADTPLAARIVAVTDSFDTITHARRYKPAVPVAAAFEELERCRGRHFDPDVVDALRSVRDRVGLAHILDVASPLDADEDMGTGGA